MPRKPRDCRPVPRPFPRSYPPRPARARDRPRDRPGRPCPARGGDARGSLWVQGKPREAGKLFDAAVEAARLAGNAQSLAWMLFNRSIAAVVAGDLDGALDRRRECRARGRMEPGVLSGTAAAVLASALLEAGQAERSVEVMLTRAGGEEIGLIGGGWRARFLEVLTRAAGDRQSECRRTRRGRGEDMRRCRCAAQRARDGDPAAAAVAFDEGDPTTAAERALAWPRRSNRFRQSGTRPAGGSSPDARSPKLASATALRTSSSRRGGVRLLRLGPIPRPGRARTAEARPAHPSSHASGHIRRIGIEALTERELQVARLVVDRKTNPRSPRSSSSARRRSRRTCATSSTSWASPIASPSRGRSNGATGQRAHLLVGP